MNATVTPWPVKPSDRAVGALGSSESAWIVCSASGSSCGLVDPGAGQAPAGGVLPAALVLAPGTFVGARWMIWSGTT